MHIEKIAIKNFRLLREVELNLETVTTLIVGRNNSGKTSLSELFRRLIAAKTPSFGIEDFSLSVHEEFWEAYQLHLKKGKAEDVRALLPNIEVTLWINYEANGNKYGPLGEFIVDVDPKCVFAQIQIRYAVKAGRIDSFFAEIGSNLKGKKADRQRGFFRALKDHLRKEYETTVIAVDPNDQSNRKVSDLAKLRTLLQIGFINANREVEDNTESEKQVLGKALEALFNSSMAENAAPNDRKVGESLESAVFDIQEQIDGNFNGQLEKLVPALKLFGFPGLTDSNLQTETTLDVGRLLKNHTKVRYKGTGAINLPESYNGLGTRNLIYIVLKLLEFYKTFESSVVGLGVHLVFIEEPEAHLHPQMQEVFIAQLDVIAKIFAEAYKSRLWPVQFVVTTHSSHMANRASFDAMRYFLVAADAKDLRYKTTQIKDLKKGLATIDKKDRDFLHQYMTLTKCDLLFADKAILIEGTSERLLLPKMIEKVDTNIPNDKKLGSQYLSILEVGGAYAHIFFDLLAFLELLTLVVTDFDTVAPKTGSACKVSEGAATSNATLKQWFKVTTSKGKKAVTILPTDLLTKTAHDKVKQHVRIAYQIPENAKMPCGRSLEAAFMLANPTLFQLNTGDKNAIEDEVWLKAGMVKKAEFALNYALMDTTWVVPKYIEEGLVWLATISK